MHPLCYMRKTLWHKMSAYFFQIRYVVHRACPQFLWNWIWISYGGWDFISSTACKLLPINISIFKYRKERSNIVKTMGRHLLGEHQVSEVFPIWPFKAGCPFSSFWVIGKKSIVPWSQQKHNHMRYLCSSSAGTKIAASGRACATAVWVRFDWSDKSHCIVSIPLAQGMCKHFKTECLCMRTLN